MKVFEAIFYVSVGLIFYTHLIYPLLVAGLAWLRGLSLSPRKRGNVSLPSVTLIIIAHNEQEIIHKKLLNTSQIHYPKEKLQILLVIDKSIDGTRRVARQLIKEKNLAIEIWESHQRLGKTGVLNAILAQGKVNGEIVVFSDATAILDPSCLKILVEELISKPFATVGVNLSFREVNESEISRNQNIYWRYEMWLRRQETRAGVLFAVSGACFATWRSLWPRMNPEYDLDCVLPLIGWKNRLPSAQSQKAKASELHYSRLNQEFKQRIRIAAKDWKAIWGIWRFKDWLSHPLVTWSIFSHRIIRWLTFLFMTCALAASIPLACQGAWWWLSIFAFLVAFNLCAVIGWYNQHKERLIFRIIRISAHLYIAYLGAFWGIISALAGKEFRIWDVERERKKHQFLKHNFVR